MKKIRKIALLMAFIMALSIPINTNAAVPPSKTGYHIVYHNGGNWGPWGAHLQGCDNYRTDTNTRMCYHYLTHDVVTSRLYPTDSSGHHIEGSVNTITVPCTDGGTWDVSGEWCWAKYNSSFTRMYSYSYPIAGHQWEARKDIRLYYFTSSLSECEQNINGKYIRNLVYYRWLGSNGSQYGLDANASDPYTGTVWPTAETYNNVWVGGSQYYHYFNGKGLLSGEQLNSRGQYPSFDCAINGLRSTGFERYDSNGNAVWNNDSANNYVWNQHTHVAYRYICEGHYAPNTYTINYHGNGATGGATGSSSHSYDTAKTLSSNGYTRANYTFLGWATTPNGGVSYANGQSVLNLTAANGGTINLYAVWRENNYDVHYIDTVDTMYGPVLGRQIVSRQYGSTVRGSDVGASATDNAYYYGYYYDSCTESTVTGAGVAVYRIFKLRTVDLAGSVTWNDKDNYYGSRPDSSVIRIYRDGTEIWNTTLPANSNSISYSVPNVQKYSTTDGHAFSYTASQDNVVSKNNDDQYITTQNALSFTNTLANNGKFSVEGSVKWKDNTDKLGLRPENVTVNLYRNNIKQTSQTLDAVDTGYSFINLDKFDSNMNPYTYTAEEILDSKVMVWNNTLQDYTLEDAYSISVNGLDFTNTIINRIYVKPSSENYISMELEFTDCDWESLNTTKDEITIPCELKKLESNIVDGEIVYGDSYENFAVKVQLEDLPKFISKIPAGKYEICIEDDRFSVNDISIKNQQGITLEKTDGKYYIIITENGEANHGDITVDVTSREHIGYQTWNHIKNYFASNIGLKNVSYALLSMFSDDIVVPDPEEYTISYHMGTDILSEETYLETTEAVIAGCTAEGFLGWAKEPDGEIVYLENDTLEMNQDLTLYAIFKSEKTVSGNGIG